MVIYQESLRCQSMKIFLDVATRRWYRRWRTCHFHHPSSRWRLQFLRNNQDSSSKLHSITLRENHDNDRTTLDKLPFDEHSVVVKSYTCYSSLTLLTRKSFSSKCRPNILGASPGMGSILMHTSCPFLALSTVLWLLSMLVTTPKSTNWKNDTMKRQKTMKSSSNDIMEPEAFTHCHWIVLRFKNRKWKYRGWMDPNTMTNTKGTVNSSESLNYH